MMLSAETRSHCGTCGDPFPAPAGDCCGRCQRIVCRACSRVRDRSRESVLCVQCSSGSRRGGLRAVPAYRAWRRWLKR